MDRRDSPPPMGFLISLVFGVGLAVMAGAAWALLDPKWRPFLVGGYVFEAHLGLLLLSYGGEIRWYRLRKLTDPGNQMIVSDRYIHHRHAFREIYDLEQLQERKEQDGRGNDGTPGKAPGVHERGAR